MIIGAHAIVYSTKPEADRAFLRDVLKFPHVDVGDGWLIFGLPPAEVAVHPADENGTHELYLMCDDVEAFVAAMRKHGIACTDVSDLGWGRLTRLTLPGGGKLGVYEPRHARPKDARRPSAPRRPAKRPARANRRSPASKRAKSRKR
jgi:catechol 2,3-dioxygenase-like lactoylglutathione lyase family enzyme